MFLCYKYFCFILLLLLLQLLLLLLLLVVQLSVMVVVVIAILPNSRTKDSGRVVYHSLYKIFPPLNQFKGQITGHWVFEATTAAI